MISEFLINVYRGIYFMRMYNRACFSRWQHLSNSICGTKPGMKPRAVALFVFFFNIKCMDENALEIGDSYLVINDMYTKFMELIKVYLDKSVKNIYL